MNLDEESALCLGAIRHRPALKTTVKCALCSMAMTQSLAGAELDPNLRLTKDNSQLNQGALSAQQGIWVNGIGGGFLPTAQSLGASAGANYGLEAFGSVEAHDLALASFSYGHMLGRVRGEGRWYRGNPEFRLELFTGAQFSPSSEWLVGLTPHLRYNFATGTRWIPFVDGGAGVTATGIGPPDLSGTFEFNLQAGGGVQWFVTDHMAIGLEVRYIHWSCAGMHRPNLGLNGITAMLGINFFL